MDRVIDFAQETECNSPDDRAEAITNLANYIDKWLWTYQENVYQQVSYLQSEHNRYYLSNIYYVYILRRRL
jgi:hypothetical protein